LVQLDYKVAESQDNHKVLEGCTENSRVPLIFLLAVIQQTILLILRVV
jgi:hypothetical protein